MVPVLSFFWSISWTTDGGENTRAVLGTRAVTIQRRTVLKAFWLDLILSSNVCFVKRFIKIRTKRRQAFIYLFMLRSMSQSRQKSNKNLNSMRTDKWFPSIDAVLRQLMASEKKDCVNVYFLEPVLFVFLKALWHVEILYCLTPSALPCCFQGFVLLSFVYNCAYQAPFGILQLLMTIMRITFTLCPLCLSAMMHLF